MDSRANAIGGWAYAHLGDTGIGCRTGNILHTGDVQWGATVLLVPLAVNIAIGVGANPAVFALTVAIATSNSFLIPTHQVNALIMGPAGYRVADFIKAGSVMTVLFLTVMMIMINLVYQVNDWK